MGARLLLILLFVLAVAGKSNALSNCGVPKAVLGFSIYEQFEDLSLDGQSKLIGTVSHNGYSEKLGGANVKAVSLINENNNHIDRQEYVVLSNDTGYFEIQLSTGRFKLSAEMPDMQTAILDSFLFEPNVVYKARVSLLYEYLPVPRDSIVRNKPQVIYFKPVIYLYSPEQIKVDLKLKFSGKFIHTYPTYKDGWEVTVKKDGRLESEGNMFDYLFWEGQHDPVANLSDMKQGSLVQKDDIIEFLEKSLTQMGLNDREKQDFISFWGSRLSEYESCFIHFATEQYDQKVPLQIIPKPDNVFRMFMVYMDGAEVDFKPVEQQFEKINRSGFTVIEWGGGQLQPDNL